MDLYEQLPSSNLIHLPEFKFLLDTASDNGVTCLDFLTQSPAHLMKTLHRSINEISKFQQALRQDFDSALQEIKVEDYKETEKQQCFTTGNEELDNLLNGGIYSKGITEIFGESSTGKSQLLLQLALTVQLSEDLNGLNGQCVYIATEGDLPTRRLSDLIESSPLFRDEEGKPRVSQKKIFTVTCSDWANQDHITSVQLPVLLERHPSIKLIIIDSISHHLRVELQSKTFHESRENRQIIDAMAEKLLVLAQKHNLAVVVANQVSDKLLPEKPVRQDFKDYDFQLGWFIGWKNSSIYYRHKYNEIDKTDDNLLSDDEDYSLIIDQLSQYVKNKDNCRPAVTSSPELSTLKDKSNDSDVSSTTLQTSPILGFKRKRAIDIKVPNLGLTWANHLMTRIKLEKWYKASFCYD